MRGENSLYLYHNMEKISCVVFILFSRDNNQVQQYTRPKTKNHV